MMPDALLGPGLSDKIDRLRSDETPFAIATIVRTVGATAAKPGAKALLGADGSVLSGWLGGGCVSRAVAKAALKALASGEPSLISVAPEGTLDARGLRQGDEVEGIAFARNGCPSEGTIDIFIEPCLPKPELVVLGTSPVAQELCALAPRFGFDVLEPEPGAILPPAGTQRLRMIVVATQGADDLAALRVALNETDAHVAFVGSRRKFAALSQRLGAEGISEAQIAAVRAPAGMDIGAVTPEEIALSITAELVHIRRRGVRLGGDRVAPDVA